MRVFLDTNVLVSAFATRGICADLFRVVMAEHQLVTGEVVLRELRRVLRAKIGLPARTIDDIEALLREQEVVPKPDSSIAPAVRDPDDRWILASAIVGKADILVTGDHDLLTMGRHTPIEIVDPRGFWQWIRKSGA